MEGYRDERPRRVVGARQGDGVGAYHDVRRAVFFEAGDGHAAGETHEIDSLEMVDAHRRAPRRRKRQRVAVASERDDDDGASSPTTTKSCSNKQTNATPTPRYLAANGAQ